MTKMHKQNKEVINKIVTKDEVNLASTKSRQNS